MSDKTLGRIAYEAYWNEQYRDCGPAPNIPTSPAWEAAALAVIKASNEAVDTCYSCDHPVGGHHSWCANLHIGEDYQPCGGCRLCHESD